MPPGLYLDGNKCRFAGGAAAAAKVPRGTVKSTMCNNARTMQQRGRVVLYRRRAEVRSISQYGIPPEIFNVAFPPCITTVRLKSMRIFLPSFTARSHDSVFVVSRGFIEGRETRANEETIARQRYFHVAQWARSSISIFICTKYIFK